MNIGLDIDGVLTDIEAFQFKYGVPFFKKEYDKDIVNIAGKTMAQIFGCKKEEENKFWGKYLFRYAIKDPVREHASDFTKWAYDNGHHIYIITSRVFTTTETVLGKLMRFIVKRWLKKSKIKYDKIIFCDEDKASAITEYQIKYMVEDDPDNIRALKDITQMICMDAKCNEHITEESVIRCHDFSEVLQKVKERSL